MAGGSVRTKETGDGRTRDIGHRGGARRAGPRGGALLAFGASVAEGARQPDAGEYGFSWKRAACVPGSPSPSGYVALASIRTEVRSVPEAGKRYYQEVQIAIDKLGVGQLWRAVEKRTYDWSRFTAAALTTYSTSGVKTAVGPTIVNGGTLSARATVKLRRVKLGPDPVIWKYEVRTAPFTCPVVSGGESGPVWGRGGR